ncbi:MAG: Arc family DNA-binding protein [Prevotella sp.]|nr:Arc family DNA-binding protein [Prevotella sp.]
MKVLRNKRQTSFRLPAYLLDDLKAEAKQQHRSLNSLVEVYLLRLMYREPNETTLAAMRECESGAELDDFTPETLDQYIYEEAEATTGTVKYSAGRYALCRE